MDSIGTTRVQDIMVTNIVTVKETDKMEFVAQLFKENDINAAPVIDENDKCIGVISSHNLVEYESVRRKMENELNHGMCYDLAHYGSGGQFRMPGQHFDEVGFHMNKTIQSACGRRYAEPCCNEPCAPAIFIMYSCWMKANIRLVFSPRSTFLDS